MLSDIQVGRCRSQQPSEVAEVPGIGRPRRKRLQNKVSFSFLLGQDSPFDNGQTFRPRRAPGVDLIGFPRKGS